MIYLGKDLEGLLQYPFHLENQGIMFFGNAFAIVEMRLLFHQQICEAVTLNLVDAISQKFFVLLQQSMDVRIVDYSVFGDV